MRQEHILKCTVCGNEFVTKNINAKYCGRECTKIAYRGRYKYEKRKSDVQSRSKSLVEIDKEAEKLGLSYGKYVAKFGL